MVGKTFNRLTVIEDDNLSKEVKCRCICGSEKWYNRASLVRGVIKSCGCAHVKRGPNIDLTGQKFGRLEVIKMVHHIDSNGRSRYDCLCQCECGSEPFEVVATNLKRGLTQSCGCLKREVFRELRFIDLTGQKFGELEVLSFNGYKEYFKNTTSGKTITASRAAWKCKCSCGNEVVVDTTKLVTGWTKSCGCIKSFGEKCIIELLLKEGISFAHNKGYKLKFDSRWLAQFDFLIPNENKPEYIIEFYGEQHFHTITARDERWENYNYDEVHTRDVIKNVFWLDNNIPLIRIPYWHLRNMKIEDLKPNSSRFLITQENKNDWELNGAEN